ncbi:MAG: tetratricopeptide repeat protein [Nitrososphaeraceae archaeon]
MDPNNKNAINNKAALLVSLGKFDQAIQYYDKALSIDPNNVRAPINKGRSLSQLHRFEEAISNYDRTLKIDPQNTDAYLNKDFHFTTWEKMLKQLKILIKY